MIEAMSYLRYYFEMMRLCIFTAGNEKAKHVLRPIELSNCWCQIAPVEKLYSLRSE